MTNYLVQTYIDISRELAPHKTAVRCGKYSITYEQLYVATNKLANCLMAMGVSRQDRVAFCLKRSINCIIAIFGILKSDAIYVPIDSKSPLKRWRQIIDDCRPTALICDSGNIENIQDVIAGMDFTPKIIVVESREKLPKPIKRPLVCQEQIDEHSSAKPKYKNIDIDIAYILYTSGSTGNPKGVMISHFNIINYIDWAVDCFNITEKDNILSTAPFHFDMSTFDVYCPMKTGSTLSIAPEGYLLFPNKILTLIEEDQITIWKAVSSLIMYMARAGSLGKGRIGSLKMILFSGEVLATKHLIRWMEIYPDKLFYNAYGPTEATGISTYYHVQQVPKDPLEPIPMGRACANTEVFLLKEDNSLTEPGEVGELCIRGSSLSRGYWNDTEKTERAFVANPLGEFQGDRIYRTGDLAKLRTDGNYVFIGRKDDQIKSMGYRIEPSEIVNTISSLDKVNDAAVILERSEKYDLTEIVAFFAPNEGVTPEELMAELGKNVPNYMLPQHIIGLKHIPRTDRGKVDRKALRQYYTSYRSQTISKALDATN
jgi:amino acid adenylation domain-containing protein